MNSQNILSSNLKDNKVVSVNDIFLDEETEVLEVASSFGTFSTFGTFSGCASSFGTVSCIG